ncbi:MAG: hypothetical protein RLY86_835, partial [Pseudomonadota bacterium]
MGPIRSSLSLAAVAAASALVLAACSSPAPSGQPVRMSYPEGSARSIFVSRGETVYDIARRYNVPIRDLIEENRLQPPYVLAPGQALKLPVPREVTVVAGDTVYGISRRFGVEMGEVVRLNSLSAPYVIQTGQTLRLPSGRGGTAPRG